MIVNLTPDEIAVCQIIGRMRSLIARSSKVKDAKQGDQDGVEADVMGMIAEFAFAKKMNCFPDLGLVPRSGSPDGVLPSGERYDVKSTAYKTGKLVATLKDNAEVDLYVLGVVTGDEVDFKGWAFTKELRLEENIGNLGHGDSYILPQGKIRKFKEDQADVKVQ